MVTNSLEEITAAKTKCDEYTHKAHELYRKWHQRLLNEPNDVEKPDFISECMDELKLFAHDMRDWHREVFTKVPGYACDISWAEERIGELHGIIDCRMHDEIFFHFNKDKKK